MPFSHLRRDKNAVLKALLESKDTGELIAKEQVKIVLPVRYEESKLASIKEDVYTLGILGFIVGDNYSCNLLPAKLRLTPTEIEKVNYQDESYYVLTFEKGSVITPSTNVIKDGTLGYYIYNYFIALGRTPWYMNAMDYITLFDKTGYYTGLTYGDNHVITEMIASMVLRDEYDVEKYWRQTLKSVEDINERSPQVVPLRNVSLGARNTTAKLMGSYFNESLNSALLFPSTNTETVEELLRQ